MGAVPLTQGAGLTLQRDLRSRRERHDERAVRGQADPPVPPATPRFKGKAAPVPPGEGGRTHLQQDTSPFGKSSAVANPAHPSLAAISGRRTAPSHHSSPTHGQG